MGDKDPTKRDDPIIAPIGDLGPYQIILCLLVFLSKYPTGTVTLSTLFLTAPIPYNCTTPNVTNACSDDCEDIEFDRSVFTENIITEYNLTCERASLASMSQSIVMFGILVGSIVCGTLSDRFGRRVTFIYICMVNLVAGLIVSVSPWFWFFCLFRFIDAFAVGGIMVTSFVIVMEVVGKSKREFMSIIYQIPFNMGHMSLPLIAYFFRSWRTYNLVFSAVSIVYVIYFCVIPESPRWLFAKGRLDESAAILEKIAKRNGKPTESIRADLEVAYKVIVANAPLKKGTMADLFRYPNLRKKSITMAFNWLVVCMTYYGVAQYVTNLSGNIFLNVAFGACLGIPGTLVCIPMTIYLGRKKTLFISNAVSGVSLLLLACLPNTYTRLQVVFATIGLFGSSVTFPNVYLYGGELFPTVVRNSGVGLCSMVGRIGSMLAPFIAQMSSFGLWIPAAVMGTFAAAAAASVLLLPETRGFPLPETIEEGEVFGSKPKPSE